VKLSHLGRRAAVCVTAISVLTLSACGFLGTGGPRFSCAIAPDGYDWMPQISVTGPTPATGILNAAVVYYDGTGQEIGSDSAVFFGFSGATVPAGQTVTYDMRYNINDAGLSTAPASCQVTGYS
jgi:hypothetical protein